MDGWRFEAIELRLFWRDGERGNRWLSRYYRCHVSEPAWPMLGLTRTFSGLNFIIVMSFLHVFACICILCYFRRISVMSPTRLQPQVVSQPAAVLRQILPASCATCGVVLLPNSIAILRINTAPKRNTICYFQNHTFNRILWLWKTSTTQLVPERSDRTSPTRRPPSHRIRDCSNRSDAAITTYTYTYT